LESDKAALLRVKGRWQRGAAYVPTLRQSAAACVAEGSPAHSSTCSSWARSTAAAWLAVGHQRKRPCDKRL